MAKRYSREEVQRLIEAAVDFTFSLTEEGFNGEYVGPKEKDDVAKMKINCVEQLLPQPKLQKVA